MSAILMFVYWIVIPVAVFRLARWLFFQGDGVLKKGLVVAATVGFFAWFLWIAVGRNMWLDHQVREMCAKDGGVKVYETVTLPPERFDKYGQVRVPAKVYAKPEDEYFEEWKIVYLHRGNPEVWRSHFKIIRRIDSMVLGEALSYHRRGGGLFGPWHESSFGCPADANKINLMKQVFIRAE